MLSSVVLASADLSPVGSLPNENSISTTPIPTYKVDSLNHYIPTFTKDKLIDFYKNDEMFRREIDNDTTLTDYERIKIRSAFRRAKNRLHSRLR